MLRSRTITQLLEVMSLYRKNRQCGESIERSLQDAIQRVAKKYNVAYQTVGDGCRRRLKLASIEDLHALLLRWDQGESLALAGVLREHTEVANHRLINEFFDGKAETPNSSSLANSDAGDPGASRNASTLSVELDSKDLARLETLAQITGSSASHLAAKFIRDTLERL